jgi:carboxymethylenebutenolidase
MERVEIETADGRAPVLVWEGQGPRILVISDGIGMRPAIQAVGEEIARHGYRVVMPDVFYRMGPYTAPDPRRLFSDPEVRASWFASAQRALSPELMRRDLEAYLRFAGPSPVGVVGYCMGGRFAFSAAGWFPETVRAAAAYHPGGLVSDKPDSPHLLAPKIRGRLYIGRASEDPSFDDQALATLEGALADAGVAHTIETYPARHGFVPADTPVHDEAATRKHYETMFALFDS